MTEGMLCQKDDGEDVEGMEGMPPQNSVGEGDDCTSENAVDASVLGVAGEKNAEGEKGGEVGCEGDGSSSSTQAGGLGGGARSLAFWMRTAQIFST